MNLLKKLLLGVAPFAAFGSHCAEAASLLTPPPASVCTSPTVPTEPGDIHAFPGRWWNPNRIGIGWDLFYGDQQRSMYLTLFTYDVDGRPVWFTGESADTQFNAVTGESIWQSRLYRVKWKGMAYQTRDSVEVGLVSITFPRQTTTRAVVRWQFTESGNPWADTAIHDECLFDYYRDSANAGRGDAALSQAYSSNWFYDAETTHPYVGWGVDLLVALDEQQQYHETATVAIFDVNQNPVWLQSNDSYGVDPPPADTLTTLPSQRGFLRYFRHNRPNGRPMLSDCAEDSCLDITPLPGNQSQKNNRFLRNITGVRSGQMSVRAQVASGITGSTATEVNWPLPVPNTQPAFPDPTPVSHFDVDHVVVDKSICRVPPNTASCRFTVSWTSNDQGAIVTRVDLRNANNSRMIGGGGSGIVQDDIAVGDRIQYRIGYWNPNDGYSYRSTPEVRTLFDSDVADANVEPVDCASGPNCDLGEHDPTVGAIAGEASAEGGAAVYTIPIKVPPGRNGMQPAVSLSYNSRAGNGIAGMGWSLSAASAIHRCPRTLDQDGYSASVALGAGDALCLDGQRLLVLDALHGQPKADQTAGYGATGAVYRTEIDNFSRVTQLGGDLSAEGACFRVEHKDGRIAYYGGVQSGNGCSSNARNSRVSPAGVGVTLNWQLEKIEDRVGNNQFYFYTNHGNGEVLLSQIRYTGKDASEGNRRVVFESETRPMASDRSSSYIAGGLTVQTRRLKQIETWVGANEQVSVYKLDYEEPLAKQQAGFYSGRSQLQKITQCAYDGGVEKCLAPTTIDWNDAPPDFVLRPLSIDGLPAPSPMPNGAQIDPRVQPLGDLDGDGTREVVVHQWDIDPQTGVLRNATWLVKQTADRAVPESLDVTALATDIATIEPDHVADFDGDGRADILGAQNNWLYLYRWKKNRGDSFDSLANTFEATPLGIAIADQLVAIEDVDGDGRVDLLLRRSEGECNAAYVMPASQQDPQMLCLHLNTTTRSGGQAQIGFATGKRLDGWTVPSAQSGLSAPGDFNGDGVRDILVSYRTSIGDRVQHVLLSKAANAPVPKGCDPLDESDRFQRCPAGKLNLFQNGNYARSDSARYWLDVNGDGLTDLLFATVPGQGCSDGSDGTVEMSVPQLPGTSGRGTWCIKLSTGRGFGNAITVGGNTDALLLQENRGSPSTGEQAMFRYAGRLPVADFDADGKANLLYPVALAARHCQYTTVTHITSSDTSTLCPYEPVNGRATNDGSAVCTNNVWMCANDPREAIEGVNTYALPALNTFPVYQPVQQQAVAVDNLYTPIVDKASYVEIDKSAYVMSGIRFEQTGPASFVATPVALDQAGTAAHRVVMRLAGDSRVDVADDLYGDGLVDTVFQIGCYTQGFRPDACQYVGGASGPSTVTISPAQGAAATTVQVTDLENGLRTWVNENVGIAETTGGPPLLPDLVGSIQNGMNDNVVWAYYPLSSKAFRSGSNVMPLYELPANDDEYADSRHFYFKSSMPVVGSMGRSAGGGLSAFGSRSWTYSYREAMYNSRGRGFQGFRTIMQEHLTLGSIENRRLRTTTTYHQKFPLTGKVERVETGVPNGNSGINPVKVETYLWGCAVATSAPCDVDSGARPANFPFLVEQTATTYDLASSEAGAQVPVATTTVRNRGLVPAKPGWDVYGNLLFQDVVSSDEYVFNATQRTQNTFATPDLGVWWVDKLSKTVKTTLSVAYQSQHSLPVGAMAPQQTLTTKYEWNADRTPSVVEIQPSEKFGVEPRDDQYAKTTYTYPGAPYNYGLPRLVATLIHRADERPLPDEPDPEKAVYQTRYVETRFDGTDGYFASEVRYPGDENGTYFLRPGIKTTSRARDGQPSLVEDLATGMRIVTTYDAFGRAIVVDTLNALGVRVKQPVRTAWQRCVGGVCPGVGAGGLNRAGQSADRLAEYRVVTAQNGAPTQVVMYDLLNREIKRAARSLDANLSFVASTTDYDVMGMATNQSAPFKLTGAQATTSYETVSTYDRLGRVKTRTTPGNELDPANGNVVSDYTYAGNRTTVRVRTANDPGCSLSSTSTLCMVMTRDASVLGLVRTTDTLGGVTTYWYDSAKRPIAIRDAKANRPDEPDYATLAQYNELGHRVVLDDPNMGHWTFKYNPFGELRKQTDARGFDTIVDLRDPLGRVVTQTSTDPKRYDSGRETVVDQWAYDPNTGLLNDVSRSYDGVERWRETYTYDALARPTTTVTSIRLPDQTYLKDLVTKFQYDTNYGREKATEYPSGLRVQTIYAKTGDVQDVLDADTGIRLWAVESKDAWGNVAVQRYGNGLVGQYTAAASTGQSLRREWLVPGQAAKDAIDYAYDSFGNLKRQTRTTPTELNPTATESYLYDRLQRLVQATPSTGTAVAYGYDAVGNFAYKSDFSTTSATAYQYQGNGTNKCGPNVATSVARPGNLTALYTCDANGNIATSDNSGNYTSQRRMVYDATNRPLVIVASGVTEFYYTPNGDRFASVSKLGAPSTAGSLVLRGPRGYEEESEYADRSQVTQRHELGEAVVTWGPGTRRWTSYRASDRLGSALGLMNDDVAKLFDQLQWGLSSKALLSFDAFGMPKDRDFKWRANASTNLGATRQGFTGHEHIVAPGGAANPEVIHMNGRAYDFRLGRFLSVDPLIQSPANSQSLNPYSYVLNNPLAGIDPSGYASCKMTDDVSCLEDGVNTVTDADGNKTSVIVGEAGDNIALSGNGFDVKDLKFVSGSINLAYNPSNGAEDWVKNGPAGTRDPSVIGGPKDASKGCAGGGPLQCYSVRSEGNEVTSFERTFKASGSTAALNGMLNNVGRAMELMAKHVRGRLGEEDFLLVHNPTEGMLRDLWESSRDKMGWTTDIAKQFAGVLASARQPMQWVAHSQGGAIFSEAIRYGFNNGVTDMSNVRVAFHAGANNRWMTGRYATRAGVGVLGYYDAPNDLVPQIVGLRAWNRPDRLLWSIYSAPSLFGEKSPHTYPYRPDY